ncbi:MAG: 23S rRNA (guanosine(2251)-2'-O)-methyltransferase RlmB [Myxococcaceae bacterium]
MTAPSDAASERFVFGVNPVREALRGRSPRVERVFIQEGLPPRGVLGDIAKLAGAAGVRVERIAKERLVRLADGGAHQGVVAEVQPFRYAELENILDQAKAQPPGLVVVCDGLQDPHNLGAVIRSAHAMGAHGVVIPKDRSVGLTGAVAKASAGALMHTPVAQVVNLSRTLETLKSEGFWVAAADAGGESHLWDARLDGPMALVIGAEGDGIRPGVLAHCDLKLTVPMAGKVGSLNASASAAILLYEVLRQRAHRKS